MKLEKLKIGIIGQGYVGLPLAIEFGKKYKTVGFDIDIERVQELKKGHDHTLEIEANLKDFSKVLLSTQARKATKKKISRKISYFMHCLCHNKIPTPLQQTEFWC